MSIKCFPLAGEQNYGVIDFQSYLGSRIQGVYNAAGNLQVTAQDPAAMAVNVSAGLAWLKTGDLAGVTFRMDAGVELVVEAADALQDRIDTVVVGLDLVNRTGYCEVVKGLIGGGATPPVRDASYYELVIAEISVTAAMSAVTSAKITDKREDNDVCGYMRESLPVITVINDLTTNSASNALSAAMGKQLQDEKAPKASPTFTGSVVLPNTQISGTADITGFTKLGTGAPNIKMKSLSGTTHAIPGAYASIAHGLDYDKILNVSIVIKIGANYYVVPGFPPQDSGMFYVWFNDTSICVGTYNESSLANKPIKLLVTYEA